MKYTKPQILIVDDKPQNLFTLNKLLQKLDVEIVQTTSPFEALNLSLEHDFCLGIIDIQMPDMDGYELVELLRSNESTATLPIIFVSAIYSDDYHHRKAYSAGAVDFLSKPFNPDILLSKVQVFLDLYAQRRQLEQTVEQLNVANTKLAKRATQLEVSSQVGRQVTSILDMDDLMSAITELILSKFECHLVAIWKLVETQEGKTFIKDHLELQLAQGRDQTASLAVKSIFNLTTEDSLLAQVAHSEKSYYAPDITCENYDKNSFPLADTQAQLALPLPIGRRIIGMLDIQSDKTHPFSEDEIVTLEMLANQVAIAIRNAELYSLVQQANDDLSRLNADKDKFFSIVAHDLKGPFLPLLGNLELLHDLSDTLSPDDVKQMSASSHQSAQRVFRLLENLLQWARMQMGRMEYEPEMINLQKVVNQSISLLSDTATSKEITLSSNIDETIEVYADEHMLDTVIRNLINNALKFTHTNGQVILSAQTNGSVVDIHVKDTGIGIPTNLISKLFTIGETRSTTGTARETGTGLGLIMCKEMVEINGGQIWVESEEGQGTTVSFSVPITSLG